MSLVTRETGKMVRDRKRQLAESELNDVTHLIPVEAVPDLPDGGGLQLLGHLARHPVVLAQLNHILDQEADARRHLAALPHACHPHKVLVHPQLHPTQTYACIDVGSDNTHQ